MKRLIVALSVCAIAGQAWSESRALLVGVGKHQHLTPVFRLDGCENDVLAMASIVGQLGQGTVATTTLLDATATKKAVLGKLAEIAKASKPGDRFVFYFSGHGTMDKERDVLALVPFDAKQGQPDTWLRREEVNAALNAIKGSKIAIIDACHSGGLVGKNIDPNFNSRFADLSGPSLSKGPGASWRVPATMVEEAESYQESEDVQYLMACTVDQQAWEFKRSPSSGKPSGVFTHHLLDRLRNPESRQQTWGALMGDVSADVQTSLAKHEKIQNPVASTAAATAPIAGGSAPAGPPASPETLQQLFLRSQPDRDMLRITFPEGANQLPIEGRLPITIQVEQRGFLILLVSRGEEAALLYPQPSRGQTLTESFINRTGKLTKFFLVGKEVGSYQVKAFLFPANGAQDLGVRRTAEEVFNAFNSGRKVTDQSKSGLEVATGDYITYEWTVEVANTLFGDRKVVTAALPAFNSKMENDEDPLAQYLRRVSVAAGIKTPLTDMDEASLTRLLNALATSSVPLYDEKISAGLKLNSALVKQLKDKNATPSPEANMTYLAALLPGVVAPIGKGGR